MCELAQAFNRTKVLLRPNKHPYASEAHVKQPLRANHLCPSFSHTDLVSTFSFLALFCGVWKYFFGTTSPDLPCLLAKLGHSRRRRWEKHLGWSFWLFLSQLCLGQQLALSITSLCDGFLLLHLLSCLLTWFSSLWLSIPVWSSLRPDLMCCLTTYSSSHLYKRDFPGSSFLVFISGKFCFLTWLWPRS